MTLPLDPHILLSLVNTLLRDRYHSLDALCEEERICRAALETRLAAAGYAYQPALGQFR